jgi:hypothetical protein
MRLETDLPFAGNVLPGFMAKALDRQGCVAIGEKKIYVCALGVASRPGAWSLANLSPEGKTQCL